MLASGSAGVRDSLAEPDRHSISQPHPVWMTLFGRILLRRVCIRRSQTHAAPQPRREHARFCYDMQSLNINPLLVRTWTCSTTNFSVSKFLNSAFASAFLRCQDKFQYQSALWPLVPHPRLSSPRTILADLTGHRPCAKSESSTKA